MVVLYYFLCFFYNKTLIFARYSVSSNDDLPNGILYFSHDKAIMKLQAALGLFRPKQHLKHDHFDRNRIFKTSKIAPFASNLGFVLYRLVNYYLYFV